ncbi:MAG: DUF4156 domain-containing protein [Burkholderiales bacterium]|nr:DUF4156 domain-containing protein [Burkholderiales bacterium]
MTLPAMQPRTTLVTLAATTLLTGALSACSWVSLRPGADVVRVATAADVTQCKPRGSTTVNVLGKVGPIDRNPATVEGELAMLARNSALDIGGDTVVPAGPVEDGKRKFDVFRCAP